jgi:hypothetical protein
MWSSIEFDLSASPSRGFKNGGFMLQNGTLSQILIIVGLFAYFPAASTPARASTPPAVQAGKCKNGMASYPTIQEAVNAAQAGATVNVCPGVYSEQVTIDKNLTLTGVANGTADAAVITPPSGGMIQNASDPSPASLNPNIAAQVFIQGPATVNLTNLIVDGNNNGLSGCSAPTLVGVYAVNSAGTFNGLNLRNQALDPADATCNSGLGIYLEGDIGNAVTVKNSTVTNYQKNGITANGYGNGAAGPVITMTGNTVVGQGPSAGTAENGIQVGFGATGQLASNLVLDNVYQPNGSSTLAGTGVLIYASNAVVVSNVRVSTTQFAIAAVSDPTYGTADGNNINNDYITASLIAAVELCSNNNTVDFNDLYSSGQAAVKVDSSCTEGPGGGSSGNGNTVTNNNFNGNCAGILEGSGTGNTLPPNALVVNVFVTEAPGSTCSSPLSSGGAPTGFPVPFH